MCIICEDTDWVRQSHSEFCVPSNVRAAQQRPTASLYITTQGARVSHERRRPCSLNVLIGLASVRHVMVAWLDVTHCGVNLKMQADA